MKNIQKKIDELRIKLDKLEEQALEEQAKEEATFEASNGLMWSNTVGENLTWKEALIFAEKLLEDGGFRDWRLPTISELQNVFDYGDVRSKIEWDYASYNYWSATTNNNRPENAWLFNQYYGYTHSYSKTSIYSVRCVRDMAEDEKGGK